MKISREEVKNAARLARLELGGEELDAMTGQLDKILSYVDKLSELDTSGIKPTTHAFSITNAFRADQVMPSLDRQEALANAPECSGEGFVVPRVI
ncbi:MAG: Asp-tRNA(Asn)/Glu-tRNA(Gln) amidotransferase GatCAB subunit C [Deltaproteobacteria bacterium]|nr:MAG: Asp-tRNA(Asn)/Glu-tRNA(Gln) amidotransferase GatCAB subunit C [Deltaproteobacteria bacterium]